MRRLRRFLIRLSTSATRRRNEERLREDLEEHLALQTDDNMRRGTTCDGDGPNGRAAVGVNTHRWPPKRPPRAQDDGARCTVVVVVSLYDQSISA